VLPSDLTAIVFSNLLWFLLTLCLGSVLVTRPYRPERAGQARHGAADADTEPLTHLVSPADPAGALALGESAAGEDFGVAEGFRVSDYLVLSDYPLDDEELAAGDEFADDFIRVTGETIAGDPADALVVEPLAALSPVGWSDATLSPRRSSAWPRSLTRLVAAGSGHSLARRTSGPARHRRPRPAYEKALAQAAAVAIAVVMAGAGIGLGLRMTSSGHTSAVSPGSLAADTFAGTAPPVITRPRVTTRARTATYHPRRQTAQAQLAATLNMIRFLGHDMGGGKDGQLLLPSLTRKAARLRAEIARTEHRHRGAARRPPARPIRLTSVTKHAPTRGGQAPHRPPVATAPVGEAGRRAEAVAYAEAQLGKPYIWGGAGPYGFDCSGLVMMAWRASGVLLAHFTGDQWADTFHISASQLQPGDLVFSNGFGHVQMYVGHGEVIQAPYTGQVVSYAPLPPPALVDGYASVFPPGHLAPHRPHGRHAGGTRRHRTRGHRRGGPRRWHRAHRRHARRHARHHAHRRHARRHAHHRRLRRHRRTSGHRRARGHQPIHRHRRARDHHRLLPRHHRPCGHHRLRGHHRPCRHHPVCGHGRSRSHLRRLPGRRV